MLRIKNLHVRVEDKAVLKGINLEINAGETHAIMGPNGAGKSTLSHILTGRDGYDITQGSIEFMGQDLTELSVDERAKAGLFLAFQYPVEIPGVNAMNFLKSALNSIRTSRGEEELDAAAFLKLAKSTAKELAMKPELLKRAVNSGFSGGEKKRFEMLQMMILKPHLAILDETDSGLDIDALKHVADGVNAMRDASRSFLVITHYQRLLDHIVPDIVHVLADGRIVETGGKELAHQLEEKGYADFKKEQESVA